MKSETKHVNILVYSNPQETDPSKRDLGIIDTPGFHGKLTPFCPVGPAGLLLSADPNERPSADLNDHTPASTDRAGPEDDVVNAVSISKTMHACHSLRVIFLFSENSLCGDRMGSFANEAETSLQGF